MYLTIHAVTRDHVIEWSLTSWEHVDGVLGPHSRWRRTGAITLRADADEGSAVVLRVLAGELLRRLGDREDLDGSGD